jgi:urea transport system substrate-binding protein
MTKVYLDEKKIKTLRHLRLMSQEELADDLRKKCFQVSIASIKRAETGKPILCRIAGELARYYGVDIFHLLKSIDNTEGLTQESNNNKLMVSLELASHSAIISASPDLSSLSESVSQHISVGVLHSQTGILRELEKGVMQATLLAIDEINRAGGLMGKQIRAVLADGQSTESGFLHQAANLIIQSDIAVIFGCSTSSSRKRVKPLIEDQEHLLFYPFQYEGIESSSDIIYVGPTVNQQALPAVDWLQVLKCERIMLVGSDYVYPFVTNEIVKQKIIENGGEVIGEHYEVLGATDFSKVIAEIIDKKPDAILLTIVGLDGNFAFLQQCHRAKIDTVIVSLVLSEDDLDAIPLELTQGIYSVFNYFQNIDNEKNNQFVKAYRQRYGQYSRIGGYMESAYVGVYLWASAVEKAQSVDRALIKQAIKSLRHTGPGGDAIVDPHNNHVWRQVRVAQVGVDREYHVVWTSPKPVRPQPYPEWRSPHEWHEFLRRLRSRWSGNWESMHQKMTSDSDL